MELLLRKILFCVLFAVASPLIFEDPNLSPDYFYSTNQNRIRQTFQDKRRQNRVTAKRVELLDKYLANNSLFIDGIMHQKIDDKHTQLTKVNKFEKAFRNLIGMKGVKYTYRRDTFWRTWRRVKYGQNEKVVCYRCQNSVNCTSCHNGGYWVIEENQPPCPFEIVSVITSNELCAINITNSINIEKRCPSVFQFYDVLSQCANPIETRVRVQKAYSKDVAVSERYPAIICGGKDFCEISTYYMITHDYVIFRIVNATNHIMYSRVMKNGKINYACATDCGHIDPTTKTVTKTDQSLVIDLINNKNKRDDKKHKDVSITFSLQTVQSPENVIKKKQAPIEHELRNSQEHETFLDINNIHNKFYHRHHHKRHPSCSSLKHVDSDSDND